MIARITRAWRGAWPSRPLTSAITLAFVAVGLVAGLLLGLVFGQPGAGAAVGLVGSLALAWAWLAVAVATERRAGRADLAAEEGGSYAEPPSHVRRMD